jgi:hypothetical protein
MKISKVSIFLLIIMSAMSIFFSFSMVMACEADWGIIGCNGPSGLIYILILPFIIIFFVHLSIFMFKKSLQISSRSVAIPLILFIFFVLFPYIYANKVSGAHLSRQKFLFHDFTRIYFDWEKDENKILKLDDCLKYDSNIAHCVLSSSSRNALDINNCEIIRNSSFYKKNNTLGLKELYYCKSEMLYRKDYIGLNVKLCKENFFENHEDLTYFQICIETLAKKEKKIDICKELLLDLEFLPKDFYYKGCLDAYSREEFKVN